MGKVKQEPIDLEWSSRLNIHPDRGDEEGKGGKYLEKENISFADEIYVSLISFFDFVRMAMNCKPFQIHFKVVARKCEC